MKKNVISTLVPSRAALVAIHEGKKMVYGHSPQVQSVSALMHTALATAAAGLFLQRCLPGGIGGTRDHRRYWGKTEIIGGTGGDGDHSRYWRGQRSQEVLVENRVHSRYWDRDHRRCWRGQRSQ